MTFVRMITIWRETGLGCETESPLTLGVVSQRLQQQGDEHAQLLRLAAAQEAQHDGGAHRGRRLPLELTAALRAQTTKQDPDERERGVN